MLADFREWAGEVAFRVMADRSGQLVSTSTLQRALTGTALPTQKALIAVITGCGGSEEDKERFVYAWRRIKKGRAASAGQDTRVVRSLGVARAS